MYEWMNEWTVVSKYKRRTQNIKQIQERPPLTTKTTCERHNQNRGVIGKNNNKKQNKKIRWRRSIRAPLKSKPTYSTVRSNVTTCFKALISTSILSFIHWFTHSLVSFLHSLIPLFLPDKIVRKLLSRDVLTFFIFSFIHSFVQADRQTDSHSLFRFISSFTDCYSYPRRSSQNSFQIFSFIEYPLIPFLNSLIPLIIPNKSPEKLFQTIFSFVAWYNLMLKTAEVAKNTLRWICIFRIQSFIS